MVEWSGGQQMKIERFEDIKAWQSARVLANLVYDATESGAFAKDFGLRNQNRRQFSDAQYCRRI